MLFRTLVGEWRMLNILWTLLLGLTAITVWDKLEKKYYVAIPWIALLVCLGKWLRVDYGWYGVLCVFVLYLFRERKVLRIFIFAVLNGVYYYPRLFVNYSLDNFISYIFATIPVVLLFFYNGELGRKTKYLYYLFYPIHMVILYAISQIGYFL